MKIYLAPMEGLADFYLRELITQTGGYDLVFTEFIRVVNVLLPKKVFLKQAPELNNHGYTINKTPIRVQLLGNNPEAIALNAVRACELGSHGIDLNFGCPSKTVNSSKGGAILLKEPDTIHQVVKAVRKAIPSHQPLSAKMRLGFDDESTMWECAHAIADAGAQQIIVHARTRLQGYKPPAYWYKAAEFEKKLGIPLIINGEIWTSEDANRALTESNGSSIMLGRGAIRNPFLATKIKSANNNETNWSDIAPLLMTFWKLIIKSMPPKYCAGRLKQWLSYMRVSHPEAESLFTTLRKATDTKEITIILEKHVNF